MAFPTYTASDLATYSGRPAESYGTYAAEALRQALLLFRLGTCLTDWPTDPLNADLARYALLSLADSLFLFQPHQEILAGVFQSETIGSYSYSKAQKAGLALRAGEPTGVMWFDLAVQQLGVCDATSPYPTVESGSLGVFEYDADRGTLEGGPEDGKSVVLGPADVNDEPDGFGGVFSPDRSSGTSRSL